MLLSPRPFERLPLVVVRAHAVARGVSDPFLPEHLDFLRGVGRQFALSDVRKDVLPDLEAQICI